MEKYNITAENLYNWDEKGFLLGLAQTTKRIITLHALKSGRIMGASQDGSREFISLLACVCADGTKLPPALIYKGESGDLMDSWVTDFGVGDDAYFTSSANGWSCNDLGLQWLTQIFHLKTIQKSGNRLRLLIVDGHSSHVNLKFITWADNNRILLLVLPPHSTHRLQPLDVGLFQPLATEYSKQISKVMAESFGLVSITKRLFWPLFKASWNAAFSEKNIKSSFRKTGIFPYDPDLILSRITRPTTPLASERLIEATPITCKGVRRLHKAYKASPSARRLSTIFHVNNKLAAQVSIQEHTIIGLIEAIKYEKQKRARGKRLNLLGQVNQGGCP